jgi:hypothetical protein
MTTKTSWLTLRSVHGVLVALTVPLGFVSRMAEVPMPELVRTYGGDVLSATCIFFGVRFVLRRYTLPRCGLIAFVVCLLIELQQLITWKPLVRLREDTAADILLGHGFLWSDLVCYAFGVAIGCAISHFAMRLTPEPRG